jgi:biotin operon repressor
MRDSDRDPFPVRHIAEISPTPPEAQWLIEQLVLALACAIIGGAPRCWKTWLAAELALAVAAGGKALGQYQARVSGPVLFYGAEDGLSALKVRFSTLAKAHRVRLESVPLYLLDVAEVRIDSPAHLSRLRRTIEKVKPRLLVLEPFVRLARGVDENSATEVSSVLGSLRTIQREYSLAVLIAHHMRKTPSAHLGQQLRGSGDFAAWSDSGLYLTNTGARRVLRVEHRNAPAPPPVHLELTSGDDAHLAVIGAQPTASPQDDDPLRAALLDRLSAATRPLMGVELREALKVRNATLLEALKTLQARGLIVRDAAGGYSFPANSGGNTAPASQAVK